jgi:hypothetical protein
MALNINANAVFVQQKISDIGVNGATEYTDGVDTILIPFVLDSGVYVPQLGDIYNGVTLIGNRSTDTSVFTGVNSWIFVKDIPRDGSPLVIDVTNTYIIWDDDNDAWVKN